MHPTVFPSGEQRYADPRWTAPSHPPVYSYERAPERTSPPSHSHAPSPAAPLPPLRATLYREREREPSDREWRHAQPEFPPAVATAASASRPRFDMFAPFSAFAPPSRPLHSQLNHSSNHSTHNSTHAPRVERLDGDDDADQEGDYFHSDMTAGRFRPHKGSGGSYHHHGGPSASDYYSDDMQSSSGMSAAAKKRSRRMSNSERGKLYRSRRKEYVEALEEEVETLKRQMEAMRVNGNNSSNSNNIRSGPQPNPVQGGMPSPYDSALLVQDRSRAGFARIICEYFSLFQFGVPVSQQPMETLRAGDSPPSIATTTLSKDALTQSTRQVGFLQSLMDPNFRFGDNFGVQMLLRQWEHYSAYHAALKFELDALDVQTHQPAPYIGAAATLKVRFSRKTIEKVFPHVLWNEPLVQRLIGLEVEYPVMNKFFFGPDGKIKIFETEVDFVGAFIKALGNTRDAMQLVGNALIKEHHLIGLEEEAAAAAMAASGTAHSPVGSHEDAGSSHSQSPTDSSSSTMPRYRFKQSEARTTEEVVDDQYHQTKSSERYSPENYHQYNNYARQQDERRHGDARENAPYERPNSGRSSSSASSNASQWTPPGFA